MEEAANRIIAELNLKDKGKIARMETYDISLLPFSMGDFIRGTFGLGRGNEALMNSCRLVAGDNELHEESAIAVITDAVWIKLKETYRLKPV